jgi:hypothetical protein
VANLTKQARCLCYVRTRPSALRIGEHTRPACGSLRPRDDELSWEVRDGGTPSPAPEMGALPSNVKTAGRMPAGPTAKMAALLFLAITRSPATMPRQSLRTLLITH